MRLIDVNLAKALLCEMCDNYHQGEPCEPEKCDWLAYLDGLTIVDAVSIVRCKDCKYNLANIEDIQDGVNINENWNACYLTELYDSVKPADFCSYGERKENE